MMESRNFSAVGRQMHISQSTVSKHIAALEKEFGVQLFTRTTRRISPTPEASRMLEHVQRMLESLETARTVVRGRLPEAAGTLRIAIPASLGHSYVFPLLPEFLRTHPLVSLDVILADEVKDSVAEGFELVVTLASPTEGSFVSRSLRVFEWVVVASPRYMKGRRVPESPIELENHEIILSTRYPEGRITFDSEYGRQSIAMKGRLRTNSDDSAYQAALSGEGVAIVPSWLASVDRDAGKILMLLPDYQLPPITASLVYPQTRFLSRRARAFIDYLVSKVASEATVRT
jgi:LysR family transcriptional regulator, regulator for bpeEF and oprC